MAKTGARPCSLSRHISRLNGILAIGFAKNYAGNLWVKNDAISS